MRSGITFAAMVPAGALVVAVLGFGSRFDCLSAQEQAAKGKTNGMTNVVIATFADKPTALSGQSLMVRTVVDNRGGESAQVPSRESPSRFTYFLRSQTAGGPVYGLSQAMTDRRRSPERPSTPVYEAETLPPGTKFEREEDIADFSDEGFRPGKYWLTVRIENNGPESSRSAVSILPLQVESLSSVVSARTLSTVVAHRRLDGQSVILQRDSLDNDPREGVFFSRQILPKGGPVSVATSIDLVPAGSGRWLAWAHDGTLTAGVGWGSNLDNLTAPIPAQGSLLSPGFQIGGGTGLFGVVSTTGRLTTYLATASGLKPHWSADLHEARGKVEWNAQRDGSVTVAWEDAGSGRIMSQSFSSEGHPAGAAPVQLTPDRPLAWGLPVTGPPVVWVVRSIRDGLSLTLLPKSGEQIVAHLPALEKAASWDFYQTAQGSSAAAVVSNGKIYFTPLTSPAWKEVSDAPGALGLHVVSLNGRSLWAEWIEPGFGFRRASLR